MEESTSIARTILTHGTPPMTIRAAPKRQSIERGAKTLPCDFVFPTWWIDLRWCAGKVPQTAHKAFAGCD